MSSLAHSGSAAGLAFYAGRWPIDPALPCLLFIHGAGGSGAYWSNHVEGLAGHANTMAVDLPGRGGSPDAGCREIADHARAVAGFIEACGLKRVVPVGFSMGGAVTLQLALDRPGVFEGLVLVSTGAKLKVAPVVLELVESNFAALLDQLKNVLISPASDPSVLDGVVADIANTDPRVIAADFGACNRFDVRERLGQIDVPVLVLSGTDDMLTPPRYSDYLKANLGCAQPLRLAGAGHCLSIEKAAEFTAAVSDFLQRLGDAGQGAP